MSLATLRLGLEELADARRARAESGLRHLAAATTHSSALRRWTREHQLARTILVVDDQAAAGAAMAEMLRQLAPVVLVGDYDAAVHAIERDHPAVVVADYHLADPHGRTGASLLAATERGPRAVLLSGLADFEALRDAASRVQAHPVSRPTDHAEVEAFVDLVRGLLHDATGDTR